VGKLVSERAIATLVRATSPQTVEITDNTIREIIHAETMHAAETALQRARKTIQQSYNLTAQAHTLLTNTNGAAPRSRSMQNLPFKRLLQNIFYLLPRRGSY
jgi:hypothetical protein